jgi:hypothetical protein
MTVYSSELYHLNEVFSVSVKSGGDARIRFQVVRHGELRIIAEPDKGQEGEDVALAYIAGMTAAAREYHAHFTVNTRRSPAGNRVPDVVRIQSALVPFGLMRLLPMRAQAAVARAFREHWGFPYEILGRATATVS